MTRDNAAILLSRVENYFGRQFTPHARKDYIADFEKYELDVLERALERIMRNKPPSAREPTRGEIREAVMDIEGADWEQTKKDSPTFRDLYRQSEETPDKAMAKEATILVQALCNKKVTKGEYEAQIGAWEKRHFG